MSPMRCEDLVDTVNFMTPNVDKDGFGALTTRTNEQAEQIIYERFLQFLPQIEQYYGVKYKGMERVQFEWCPPNANVQPHAENSSFLRGKWLRTKQRDLSAVLFLSDYQESAQFDHEFEVYGGKLEFPQHKFGFNAQRGTLVVFPSDPHFINLTTKVLVGDLYQARLQVALQDMLVYNPAQYPGNYTKWFTDL